MEPILTVDGLSISFTQYDGLLHQRRLPVIRDLSLTVAPGQVVAVLGASGSGKSLLAHGILGLLPANSHLEGQILYNGEPLTPTRAAALRGHEISLVPQGAGYLDPLMQVGPQLCKGQRTLRDKCRRVLARYGLGPETESLYPFELSGGMSRRVMKMCIRDRCKRAGTGRRYRPPAGRSVQKRACAPWQVRDIGCSAPWSVSAHAGWRRAWPAGLQKSSGRSWEILLSYCFLTLLYRSLVGISNTYPECLTMLDKHK